MKNAREAAFRILLDVDFKGAYSNLAVKDGVRELTPVDKAFATRLVYGCISMRLTLDYVISVFSDTKPSKLSDRVTELLRMGIYQILYMDKVPDSAAVNECVRLAKRYAGRSSGFVNAVLRNVSRRKNEIEFPAGGTEQLSVRYSFPPELCERLTGVYGYDFTRELLEAMCAEPEMIIRCNLLKISRDELIKRLGEHGIPASAVPCFRAAVKVSGLDVGGSPEFAEGLYTVQDTAAQLACEVLSPKPGDRVIDLCAAPGGKTTYLAELMENRGSVTAFDVHPHKTELIRKNALRAELDIVEACTNDSSVYNGELAESADKILVDAPCSGLGIVRRKPEIKWNSSLRKVSALHEIQKSILENAVSYLKPGGEIVYCTCTILPEENERTAETVLDKHPELERVDITPLLPEHIKKETAKDGYVTLFPNTDGTDGFFICKLRKKK